MKISHRAGPRLLAVPLALAALTVGLSFAFAQATQPPSSKATVKVVLPAGGESATVLFGAQTTTSTGLIRIYESPPLEAGKNYYYEVTATWKVDGKDLSKKIRVDVKPGETATADFTKVAETKETKKEETKKVDTKKTEDTKKTDTLPSKSTDTKTSDTKKTDTLDTKKTDPKTGDTKKTDPKTDDNKKTDPKTDTKTAEEKKLSSQAAPRQATWVGMPVAALVPHDITPLAARRLAAVARRIETI